MRWFICTVLSILFMLSATAETVASGPNFEIVTKDSRFVTSFPVRELSTAHNGKAKRSLRGNSNHVANEELKSKDEERGIRDYLLNKIVNRLFKLAYIGGMTPLTLRAKNMGRKSFIFNDYKIWWETVQKTGKMPKWNYQDPKWNHV
ncbi:hypothetical protein F441_02760 [Phytophthora nicotianae CJ01A1]|uniref:RxLR effector protein n=2 Tax=Phytophthora nicotianae TaxID=4792 RepID=W2JMI5_PHYNI|nr:hypothetical protein L915_02664 [Phytophthora nicotianae]ETL47629.1 hypothetical protein L916_02640 [Phytophthora nicotianae]ETP24205.1 hypothetical protein F441_02760 [Phytophthora nicotianae CJ01A1]